MGVGDLGAGRVSDERDFSVVRGHGVDCRDQCGDVSAQGDLGTIGVLRSHTGQRHQMSAVTGLLEDGNDLLP
jgi:hypothetical protein